MGMGGGNVWWHLGNGAFFATFFFFFLFDTLWSCFNQTFYRLFVFFFFDFYGRRRPRGPPGLQRNGMRMEFADKGSASYVTWKRHNRHYLGVNCVLLWLFFFFFGWFVCFFFFKHWQRRGAQLYRKGGGKVEGVDGILLGLATHTHARHQLTASAKTGPSRDWFGGGEGKRQAKG